MESIIALLESNSIFTPRVLMEYWGGFVTTVQLTVLALILGLLLAVPLAIMRTSKNPLINYPVFLFTYVFRGTPLLIQLYMIYYGVTLIEGIQESVFWVVFERAFYPALIAFTLNTTAYTTEIFRGAIQATSNNEIEAAKAYGMSRWLMMRRIILPSAFRRALPTYSNEVIFMLHATSIASLVTIMDLTGVAREIYARFYAPFPAFIFVACLYLILTFALVYLFKRIEGRVLAHLRPR
ncbi:MAG: ABC transporter permease [Saccharospirillum sp.]|jgi:arginine/ornithine transport system permease protein